MTKKEKQKIKDWKFLLQEIRRILEPRYGEKLSDERVENIASHLGDYAKVCQNAFAKQQGLKPMYKI